MSDNNIELSRRKVLGGLGAIGLTSAGAGLGTSAYFSDEENFTNNQLVAGELDMKVAYSAHYSDWSPDEDGSDTETGEDDVDVEMWSGPAGTTGGPGEVPDGYTGLPTNAAWLIAVDDPDQFLANTEYASDGTASCGPDGTDSGDLDQPVIELEDVKPGDFGEVTFDFALCDNPGYVWLQGALVDAGENGVTEPEMKDPDEDAPDGNTVELLDVVQAAAWVDDGDNYQNGEEAPAIVGSLRDVLNTLSTGRGLALTGDLPAEDGGGTGRNCFSTGATNSVAFAWWVPIDHGNEIQTDSATFDLGFYTEQCRHNDGAGLETLATRVTADGHFAWFPRGPDYWGRSTSRFDMMGPAGGRWMAEPTSDGGIRCLVKDLPENRNAGFDLHLGPLGDIDEVTIEAETIQTSRQGGTAVLGIGLYLDTNDNGEFFAWNDGPGNTDTWDSFGGDAEGLTGAPAGTFTIDDTTNFDLFHANASSATLGELKNGVLSGIDGTTNAAIYIGVLSPGGGTEEIIVGDVTVERP